MLEQYYFGRVVKGDLDDAVQQDINRWCNERTEGLINSFPIEKQDAQSANLLIANLFNGRWVQEFYKGYTKKEPTSMLTIPLPISSKIHLATIASWALSGGTSRIVFFNLSCLYQQKSISLQIISFFVVANLRNNQMYSINTSQTAMMWQRLPARTKKWKTECINGLL